MKKFDDLLKEAYKMLSEDSQPAIPNNNSIGGQQTAEAPAATDATTPAAPGTGGDEALTKDDNQEKEKLTSEGEVMLIRLLVKALVVKPKPEDTSEILALGDINPENANEQLKKIIAIIRKYSPDLDLGAI
jgi:hypothetical protein